MAKIYDADDVPTAAEAFERDELVEMMRDLHCLGCGSAYIRILSFPQPGSWCQREGRFQCHECRGVTHFTVEHIDGSPIEPGPPPTAETHHWFGGRRRRQ